MTDPKQPDHLPRTLWWLLAALTLVWGFNWTAMKVSLAEIPPWTFRALCLLCGSAVLFLVLRLSGEKLAVPRGQWGRLWMLALVSITIWNLFVAFGLRSIPSGRAAILAYLMPAWAIPLSILVLGEKFTGRKLVGLALGMAALLLLLGDGLRTLGTAPLGSLLVVGASVSWALGTVLQKRYPVAMPTASYTAWIMLLGGVPMILGALLFEDTRWAQTATFWPIAGLLYNIFAAFAFAHWAWIKIATSVPVGVFSLSMLVIPVVGVISGMLFLGERPSWAEYVALALVLASLLTVVLPARQAK